MAAAPVSAFLAVCALAAPLRAKPNIVILLADDLTRFDLGCYGSRDAVTPAIDDLAAQGMRFTRCQQASPICSPTRQNLLTGMHPTRSGAYPNHTFVNPGVKSVVHRLKPLGYRVALSGKRHFGPDEAFPFEFLDNESDGGDGEAPDFPAVDAFLADAVARKDPFCLFLMSHQPHSPWNKGDPSLFSAATLTLPPHYVDNAATRQSHRAYLAEVNYLDGQVRQALDLLEKHSLSGNTAVIFASEQGTSMPFAKWTLYNAGLGSALIVKWPGVVRPGSVTDALVDYSDLLPTFIDIAGGTAPAGLDGSSFVPVLRGVSDRHRSHSFGLMTTRGIHGGSEYFPIRSVVDGRYRLILNYAPEVAFHNQAEMPGWEASTRPADRARVERYRRRPPVELYDDLDDRWNLENLAGDPRFDPVRTALAARLADWLRKTGDDPFQTELSAFDHMKKEPFNGDTVLVIQERAAARAFLRPAPGLRYALYQGEWNAWPDLSALTPFRTGTVPGFDATGTLPGRDGGRYAVRYAGYVRAPVAGFHTFYLNSFNRARLSIDGRLVVTSPASDGAEPRRRYGAIALDAGWHQVEVELLGKAAKDSLSVTWSYPGLIEAVGNLKIPEGSLQHGDPVPTGPGLPEGSVKSWTRSGSHLLVPPGLRDAEVRLYDIRGRLVRRLRGADRIGLAGLGPGLFFIQAGTDRLSSRPLSLGI